jgi:hypothetical protein
MYTLNGKLARNVPAVYDVFAVAMKECEAFQQPQNVGAVSVRGVADLANGTPRGFSPEAYTDLLDAVFALLG